MENKEFDLLKNLIRYSKKTIEDKIFDIFINSGKIITEKEAQEIIFHEQKVLSKQN